MMLVTLVMKGDGFRYASETRGETKTSEGLLGVSSRRDRMRARCSAITELSNTIRDTESMLNEQSRILEMAVKNI